MDQIVHNERASSSLVTKLKEDDDYPSNLGKPYFQPLNNILPHTNTTNSSRKSSISECVAGTPPTSTSVRTLINEPRDLSINFNDEQTDMNRKTNNSMSNSTVSILKSSSIAFNHDFLKRNHKSFGARFSGCEQLILFSNEGTTV